MLTVNELFSGIGSQSAALKRLGVDFKVVGIAEIDKYAIASYEAIHGKTRNYGDISKIDKLDYADFWTYSFPCQDISVTGKQRGINENTRSGLLYEVERLLYRSTMCGEQPKYLMLENVKNLVGKQFKPHFDEWIERLDQLGYNTYWKVLNAKNYGIPQNRERVFAISIRKDIDTEYEFPIGFDNGKRLKDILEAEVDEKTSSYFGNKYINKNMSTLDKAFKMKMAKIDGEISQCITARMYSSANAQYVTREKDFVTIISAKESWKLMGFTAEDFYKAEKVCSNSQLYKQAGNSIVVDVLYYLFKNLFQNEL